MIIIFYIKYYFVFIIIYGKLILNLLLLFTFVIK